MNRYFEIEFSNDNTIDRSTEGHETDCSICIIGTRCPSFEEATIFCKTDMEKLKRKYVVSITEISKEEAYNYYDMENEDNLPVFQ